MRRRPAVLSILLVAAVAVGVFATSSLAVPNTLSRGDPRVAQWDIPFESLRFDGGVRPNDTFEPTRHRLRSRAIFTLTPAGEDILHPGQPTIPDLTIVQSVAYPTQVAAGAQFAGPLALPFGTQELVLTITLYGECFEPTFKGGFRLRPTGPECAAASLQLVGGENFDVTGLLVSVDARLFYLAERGATWALTGGATFDDPGYSFPIATTGRGGASWLLIGPPSAPLIGGMAGIRYVEFIGR